jgi:hypothetical protein
MSPFWSYICYNPFSHGVIKFNESRFESRHIMTQQFCVHISWKCKVLLQEHILYVVCSRVAKILKTLMHLPLVTHLLFSIFTLGGEIHQASI